ncbi:MAG: methyltransferase domain-containing protein, partial [Bacteroides sp.]|nr:methyltransferase domain-containing protein [Bacteroides sp.]
MDKQLIAGRFARARNTYPQEAKVQQQVIEKMMHLLPDLPFRRIAEFGCGTGSYSRILMQRLQPDALLLNDLCPEMKECLGDLLCQNGVQFVSGDAETLEFPKDTELITSCST